MPFTPHLKQSLMSAKQGRSAGVWAQHLVKRAMYCCKPSKELHGGPGSDSGVGIGSRPPLVTYFTTCTGHGEDFLKAITSNAFDITQHSSPRFHFRRRRLIKGTSMKGSCPCSSLQGCQPSSRVGLHCGGYTCVCAPKPQCVLASRVEQRIWRCRSHSFQQYEA